MAKKKIYAVRKGHKTGYLIPGQNVRRQLRGIQVRSSEVLLRKKKHWLF